MVSVRARQLEFKKELKIFPQETAPTGKNRFAPELNEKEVIELLEDLSNILGAFLIKRFLIKRASLAIYHLVSNARSWNTC